MNTLHTFHIPVMGIGFTLDSPIKVAKYGIDSCISLVQDHVVEKARGMYSKKYKLDYTEIPQKENGSRYKRITAYLNMVNTIVNLEFEKVLTNDEEQRKYFSLLPSNNSLKLNYMVLKDRGVANNHELEELLKAIKPGSIDVNIMSKLDRVDEKSGISDALAALKGYAESELESNIVFSAGINPRLIAAIETYSDFFPQNGKSPKKKIILKVSDVRSATIQAKMLVKKGLWPHEFRVESGLNCGGHAFATQGLLLGPVLEAFKQGRGALYNELREMYLKAIEEKEMEEWLPSMFLISVQGGVGTAEEHEFLQQEYCLEKTGWGSPFLLVPEATSVDDVTIKSLAEATEDDIYLSNSSPMGISYNNLRNSEAEKLRLERIAKGKPGSPCFRKHVVLSTEYEKPLCAASREYQKRKIADLEKQQLPEPEHKAAFESIVEKECICDGLAVSFLRLNDMVGKDNIQSVSVCPGPNLAYYDRIYSLKEMVDHIYGRQSILKTNRPHMFLKELDLYVTHFKNELKKVTENDVRAIKYITGFRTNLMEGIQYYEDLFKDKMSQVETLKQAVLTTLNSYRLAIS